MLHTVIATAALFGVSVSALGSAVVVNKCSYPVYLYDVPAAGGGAVEQDKTLSTGESWSQQWVQLTNGDGWSIKLSKDTEMTNIMQYEFTYHTYTPDIIWFDLSDVNGNPWDGNWDLTSDDTTTCDPKQQAYMYSTDDAYGMQACPSDSSITVTLCAAPGSAQGNSTSPAPASAPAPAPASSAPTTTSVVELPATTSVTEPTTSIYSAPAPSDTGFIPFVGGGGLVEDDKVNPKGKSLAAPKSATTFATSVTQAPAIPGVAQATVTEIDTAIVTAVVTAVAPGRMARRHEHHPRHHHA